MPEEMRNTISEVLDLQPEYALAALVKFTDSLVKSNDGLLDLYKIVFLSQFVEDCQDINMIHQLDKTFTSLLKMSLSKFKEGDENTPLYVSALRRLDVYFVEHYVKRMST